MKTSLLITTLLFNLSCKQQESNVNAIETITLTPEELAQDDKPTLDIHQKKAILSEMIAMRVYADRKVPDAAKEANIRILPQYSDVWKQCETSAKKWNQFGPPNENTINDGGEFHCLKYWKTARNSAVPLKVLFAIHNRSLDLTLDANANLDFLLKKEICGEMSPEDQKKLSVKAKSYAKLVSLSPRTWPTSGFQMSPKEMLCAEIYGITFESNKTLGKKISVTEAIGVSATQNLNSDKNKITLKENSLKNAPDSTVSFETNGDELWSLVHASSSNGGAKANFIKMLNDPKFSAAMIKAAEAYTSTFKTDPKFDELKAKTAYLNFVAMGMMGVIYMLPEETSNWNRTDFNKPGKGLVETVVGNWNENIRKGPVVDKDEFLINYVGHPWSGGIYYILARRLGYTPFQSFLYSTFMSTIYWEYGWESIAEVPSIQDLILTPVVGSLLGEAFYIAVKKIEQNDGKLLNSKILGKSALLFLDPLTTLSSGIGSSLESFGIKGDVEYGQLKTAGGEENVYGIRYVFRFQPGWRDKTLRKIGLK